MMKNINQKDIIVCPSCKSKHLTRRDLDGQLVIDEESIPYAGCHFEVNEVKEFYKNHLTTWLIILALVYAGLYEVSQNSDYLRNQLSSHLGFIEDNSGTNHGDIPRSSLLSGQGFLTTQH